MTECKTKTVMYGSKTFMIESPIAASLMEIASEKKYLANQAHIRGENSQSIHYNDLAKTIVKQAITSEKEYNLENLI